MGASGLYCEDNPEDSNLSGTRINIGDIAVKIK